MDNLEVWSLKAQHKPAVQAEADKLAKAIRDTFWNPVDKHFLVSTQLEQRAKKQAFYPHQVAQIFPLLLDFPLVPAEAGPYYRAWAAPPAAPRRACSSGPARPAAAASRP